MVSTTSASDHIISGRILNTGSLNTYLTVIYRLLTRKRSRVEGSRIKAVCAMRRTLQTSFLTSAIHELLPQSELK